MTTPTLAGQTASISISESPDLERLGFLAPETERDIAPDLRRVMSDVLRTLIAAGATIQYGGDLRPGGFTFELMKEAAASYRLAVLESPEPVFVNVLASTTWPRFEPALLFDAAVKNGEQGVIHLMDSQGRYWTLSSQIEEGRDGPSPRTVLQLEEPGLDGSVRDVATVDELAALLAERDDTQQDATRSLTLMRRTMARAEIGRLLVGGKVAGYGYGRPTARPGIVEEAIESMRAGKLVLPVAAYGGASHDIAVAMKLIDPLIERDEVGPNYRETLAEIGELLPGCLERWEQRGVELDALKELACEDVPAAIAARTLRLFETVE